MGEEVLRDAGARYGDWSVTSLRSFNPIGARHSGRIGEDPLGAPTNLVPCLALVAIGRLPFLEVFGGDYPTADGTGVWDYLHVLDLAAGHRVALEVGAARRGHRCYNLGTRTGTSVLQLLESFSRACGRALPYRVVHRRPGDVAVLIAAPGRARAELGRSASRGTDAMCRDAWHFQELNPSGYSPTTPVGALSRSRQSAHDLTDRG